MDYRALFCIGLILLAGCSGTVPADGDGSQSTETVQSTATSTPEQAEPTPQPTANPQLHNPWQKEVVVVGVTNADQYGVNLTREVQSAIRYWEQNDDMHTEYNVDFELRPNAANPDLRIDFVDTIEVCTVHDETDPETTVAGCAPVLTEQGSAYQEHMEVVAAAGPRQIQTTLRHEFGHVLGLNHDSEPKEVMSYSSVPGSVKDAEKRDNPWYLNRTVKVGIEEETIPQMSYPESRDATRAAIEYYQEHPEYVPANTDIEYVENDAEADILISGDSQGNTSYSDEGSRAALRGLDYDSDAEFEQYTFMYVEIGDIRELEYHAGYWVGIGLGNNQSELPRQYGG